LLLLIKPNQFMKNVILSICLLLTAFAAKAQIDLSVNPIALLWTGLQVSLEYNANESWGIGGDLLAAEDAFLMYAVGKHYFNPKNGCDKFNMGAYVGGSGTNGYNGFGLGFLFGYKAVSSKKVIFEIALGGGRDFTGDISFCPMESSTLVIASA
jgi:hypothetical protein